MLDAERLRSWQRCEVQLSLAHRVLAPFDYRAHPRGTESFDGAVQVEDRDVAGPECRQHADVIDHRAQFVVGRLAPVAERDTAQAAEISLDVFEVRGDPCGTGIDPDGLGNGPAVRLHKQLVVAERW